ncbi:hypothetical protein EVAR_38083_1 [Eumeta japonica]|uniref:Uncharacterized protein n=1 Tax=Eumeta variegata TaxID=151549 RepID=A0A4C1WAZ0_EUMVA|nr:hypothetical protein EVAR_38083_1 [Eumeta japonica]
MGCPYVREHGVGPIGCGLIGMEMPSARNYPMDASLSGGSVKSFCGQGGSDVEVEPRTRQPRTGQGWELEPSSQFIDGYLEAGNNVRKACAAKVERNVVGEERELYV